MINEKIMEIWQILSVFFMFGGQGYMVYILFTVKNTLREPFKAMPGMLYGIAIMTIGLTSWALYLVTKNPK